MNPPPPGPVIAIIVVVCLVTGLLGVYLVHLTFKSVLGLDIPALLRELFTPSEREVPNEP